jgi:1,4-dihydroxy-2-naphthoate octaprenyltransferase
MKSPVRLVLSIIKPINLLLTGLAYLLGISVAKYLGITINPTASILGGFFVVFVLSASSVLEIYFSPAYRYPPSVATPEERVVFRRFSLYLSVGLLALATVSFFFLFALGRLTVLGVSIVSLYLVIALVNAVPPVRLVDRGFGELAMALLISGFSVLFGFALQAMVSYRLVLYLGFPLVFIALAYLLSLDFPSYAADQKFGHQSLLVRLTWQRAVPVHNLLLIISYLLFAAAPLLGIPYRLVWPTLLTLPMAIYQMLILRNITLGMKPNWTILTINATALIGIVTYLLMFTFWVR